MLLFYPSFSNENKTEVTGVKSKSPSCCFTNPDMLNCLLLICVYIYILDSYRFVIFVYIHKSTVIALTHWQSFVSPLRNHRIYNYATLTVGSLNISYLSHLQFFVASGWVWEDYKACVIQGLFALVFFNWVVVWNMYFFIPISGNDPIWRIFFRWVGTTNKLLVAFDVRCRSPENREGFRHSYLPSGAFTSCSHLRFFSRMGCFTWWFLGLTGGETSFRNPDNLTT